MGEWVSVGATRLLYRGRLAVFFLRMSLAASFARPRIMPELLRMASGHRAFAALWSVEKSSVFILTFTWTVRFPPVSISFLSLPSYPFVATILLVPFVPYGLKVLR